MFIHTQSGSVYEINQETKEARRLFGEGPPTKRVGDTWNKYTDLELELGSPMLIIWRWDGPIARSTVTSKVVKIGVKEIQ